MKPQEVKESLVNIRLAISETASIKVTIFDASEEQFFMQLKRLKKLGIPIEVLRQFESCKDNADEEMLAYLLVAEIKKLTDKFFKVFEEVDDFIKIWPEIKNAFVNALLAIATNNAKDSIFIQRIFDGANVHKLYADMEFAIQFSEILSEILQMEIRFEIENEDGLVKSVEEDDGEVDEVTVFQNKINAICFGLHCLTEVHYAFDYADDEHFNMWVSVFDGVYPTENFINQMNVYRNAETEDEEALTALNEMLNAYFLGLQKKMFAEFFKTCNEFTKELQHLDEADIGFISDITLAGFGAIMMADYAESKNIEKMADIIMKWWNWVDDSFLYDLSAYIPNNKAFAFINSFNEKLKVEGLMFSQEDLQRLKLYEQKHNVN